MVQESKAAAPGLNGHWFNAEGFLKGLHRVNLFVGGYGSGKSEIAVNFALSLVRSGREVWIGDLDIVNPYFRTREVRAVLEGSGVGLLLPPVEIMESDLPLIQPEVRGALEGADGFLVLDVGGDPVGARVLAGLAGAVPKDDYNCFFVVNSRRPFSESRAGVQALIKGIEAASGIAVTHLVANSHLIDETEPEVIEEGIALAEAVRDATGIPLGFVAVERRLLGVFEPRRCRYPVLVLDRQLLKPWETGERLGPERFKL